MRVRLFLVAVGVLLCWPAASWATPPCQKEVISDTTDTLLAAHRAAVGWAFERGGNFVTPGHSEKKLAREIKRTIPYLVRDVYVADTVFATPARGKLTVIEDFTQADNLRLAIREGKAILTVSVFSSSLPKLKCRTLKNRSA